MTPTEFSTMIETSIRTLLTDHTITTLLRKTSDAVRTSLIKSHLCDLGKNLGFHVSASGCAADNGEWLYDMVWATMESGLFVHQAMVMESEWRMGVPVLQGADVDSDFQKLVQARADVRVWICTVANDEIAQRHIENCENQIRKFTGTLPDDRYIFVILIWSRDDFELKAFPPRKGEHNSTHSCYSCSKGPTRISIRTSKPSREQHDGSGIEEGCCPGDGSLEIRNFRGI